MARRRLRVRLFLWLALLLAVIIGLAWLLVASPWLSLRQVRVDGGPPQLFRDTGLTIGEPLYLAPLAEARSTLLAKAPWLANASLSRVFPDQLVISVTARQPVALAFVGAGALVGLDPSGVTLPVKPTQEAAYPYLTGVAVPPSPYQKITSGPGLAALRFLTDLPPSVRGQVSELVVSGGEITVFLLAGTEIALGQPVSMGTKARLLVQILAQARAKSLTVTRVDLTHPSAPLVTATP